MASPPDTTSAAAKSTRDPVVVDLGSKRRKQIKRLRRGQGPLMDQINEVLNELKTAGTLSGTVQPVIVVVRERTNSKLPFFGLFKK